jgi:hypothetical protein
MTQDEFMIELARLQAQLDAKLAEQAKLIKIIDQLECDLGLRERPIEPFEEAEDKE